MKAASLMQLNYKKQIPSSSLFFAPRLWRPIKLAFPIVIIKRHEFTLPLWVYLLQNYVHMIQRKTASFGDRSTFLSLAPEIVHLSRNWKWMLFLGIASVIFGITCFLAPTV